MSRQQANPFKSERASPRTTPQQRRAEETIEKIKAAMVDLVMDEGYAAATTNRIARQAQVNIASLYRYFPNRSAIVLALYEENAAELARLVHHYLIGRIELPLRDGLCQMIDAVVGFLDARQIILMRLIDEVPELRESAQAMALENLARSSSIVYLEHHLGKLDAATLRCKLFFVQHLSMDLIRRYVSERPPPLPRAQFVAELTELIVDYLMRTPAPACVAGGVEVPAGKGKK